MKMIGRIGGSGVNWSLAGFAMLAALVGAGLAGWLDRGTAIFLAMAETGLSWCF